jgi:hypothetical protein
MPGDWWFNQPNHKGPGFHVVKPIANTTRYGKSELIMNDQKANIDCGEDFGNEPHTPCWEDYLQTLILRYHSNISHYNDFK